MGMPTKRNRKPELTTAERATRKARKLAFHAAVFAPEQAAKETAERDATIRQLAALIGFETLETRNSDSADFKEVAVWSLKEALEAAYAAGKASK